MNATLFRWAQQDFMRSSHCEVSLSAGDKSWNFSCLGSEASLNNPRFVDGPSYRAAIEEISRSIAGWIEWGARGGSLKLRMDISLPPGALVSPSMLDIAERDDDEVRGNSRRRTPFCVEHPDGRLQAAIKSGTVVHHIHRWPPESAMWHASPCEETTTSSRGVAWDPGRVPQDGLVLIDKVAKGDSLSAEEGLRYAAICLRGGPYDLWRVR